MITHRVKEEEKKITLAGFLTFYVSLMPSLFNKRNSTVSTSMLQVAIVHSLHCIQRILKNKKNYKIINIASTKIKAIKLAKFWGFWIVTCTNRQQPSTVTSSEICITSNSITKVATQTNFTGMHMNLVSFHYIQKLP